MKAALSGGLPVEFEALAFAPIPVPLPNPRR
jgi:hypothetical protein